MYTWCYNNDGTFIKISLYVPNLRIGCNWWMASELDVVHPKGKGKGTQLNYVQNLYLEFSYFEN